MDEGASFGLYQFVHTNAGVDLLYALGLLVSVAFTLGLFTRLNSILFFVFTWSIYQRNYYAIDGGENLLIILSFYLMFADLSAVSVDRLLFGSKTRRWWQIALHNYAITACLLQLSLVYFISDFYKIRGHVWADGTALYYILRTNEFSLPGWTDVITRSPVLTASATYVTVIFEGMYAWCIWHPRLKYVVFFGAVLLHVGIAVMMGLVWFSVTMIAVTVLFFDDDEIERVVVGLRDAAGHAIV